MLYRRALRIFLCAIAIGLVMNGRALADRRVALIIGNGQYQFADKLANTVTDATAIGALLTRSGFDVVDVRRNVGVVEFKRALREFFVAASNADIAVVYYSGHGFEVSGVNYLIPVDARLTDDSDVQDETVALDRLIEVTQSARKLGLIILDACRDNPFLHDGTVAAAPRAAASRLGRVAPTGADTLIAYAAKGGSVSYDGAGPNSPFTTALLKHIAEPGLDIRIALGKVRDDVLASTAGQQEPFVYGSLGGAIVSLVPASGPPDVATNAKDDSVAADYAMAERVGSIQAWSVFLAAHGAGRWADLARAQLARRESAPARAEPQKPAGGDAPPAAQGSTLGIANSGERDCKSEEAALVQLRRNPDADKVTTFAQQLACDELRPQVDRFMESLGLAPLKAPRGGTAAPPALDMRAICKRDAAELARIRANPDRESALRFSRELRCDDLRPQVARLLDSVGD
jgi:uncharacterized caspase-like protein